LQIRLGNTAPQGSDNGEDKLFMNSRHINNDELTCGHLIKKRNAIAILQQRKGGIDTFDGAYETKKGACEGL
jgi:hypothetical protein